MIEICLSDPSTHDTDFVKVDSTWQKLSRILDGLGITRIDNPTPYVQSITYKGVSKAVLEPIIRKLNRSMESEIAYFLEALRGFESDYVDVIVWKF